MSNEVAITLEQLEQAQRVEGKFKVKQLSVEGAANAPWLGVDTQGRPLLLVPSDQIHAHHEWSGASLTVEIGPNTVPSGPDHALIARCQRAAFTDYFVMLVQGILARMQSSPGEDGALIAVKEIDRWKAFFMADAPSHVLSTPQLAGLFAELITLDRLRAAGVVDAVGAWQGPLGEPQDFRLGDDRIEVKATLGSGPLSVEINGLRQLARPDDGQLLLSVHRLELHPNGDSVPDVVNRLAATGVSMADLMPKLSAIGFHPALDSEHHKVKFREVEHHCYTVDEDFPRVSPETLSTNTDALEGVHYRVLLGAVQEADPAHPRAGMVRPC